MRVVICDDQGIVREGIKLMLMAARDIEVVGIGSDGAEAVDLVAETKPDLVLMDLKMPIMNGIEATRQIVRQHPEIPVLVLTTYDADKWVFDAIRAGAKGYILKDTPHEQLIAAVRGTVAGQSHIDPDVAGKLLDQVTRTISLLPSDVEKKLSERELDVLRLIAIGQTNGEIANSLSLSEGTVRNYVSGILTKLEVSDRTQAAVMALRHGLTEELSAPE